MEEEAPSRRSVAELAGRFKGSAPPNNKPGNEAEKPVRRRPPRTLQLPKAHGDDQEASPGVTSPVKAKRNSALIEKLQANLALSPTAPPLKSPGLRGLPLPFTPPSPGSALPTAVTTSSTTTPTSPVPASFEDPPSAAEGTLLSSINKGRARVSIRRRPPSRRHRKSSSGDEVVAASDAEQSSPKEAEDKTPGGEEVFHKEGQTDAPGEHQAHEEEKTSADVKEEDPASSHLKGEEKEEEKEKEEKEEEVKEKEKKEKEEKEKEKEKEKEEEKEEEVKEKEKKEKEEKEKEKEEEEEKEKEKEEKKKEEKEEKKKEKEEEKTSVETEKQDSVEGAAKKDDEEGEKKSSS
ncbi:duboraya [Leuresthes tenuis]|uniref:duboraya n=1 Tax=Leuresthes tenuis TaxID=355514 RepID=UPI003B51062A